MIKLNKFDKPDVLVANEQKWKDEYIRLVNGEEDLPKATRYRYRNPAIKEVLRAESADKCIFCESKISHVFPGETDHIIPISKVPELAVDWRNLGYVCKECNRHKRDYYDRAVPIINPFEDDPEEHLLFCGPMVFGKAGSRRGSITVSLLKLDRPALIERKAEKLESIQLLIDKLDNFPEPSAREFLVEEIKAQSESSREYSATVRHFLEMALD